jgi:peroxiredoxin
MSKRLAGAGHAHFDLRMRRSVMRNFIIIVLILMAGGAAAEVMALSRLDTGDPYPPFCAQQFNGKEVCSSTYKDDILVVSFVKTEGKKSLKVMLNLQDLHSRYSTKNVSVIGILSGEVDLQKLMAFTTENTITFPLFLDGKRQIYGSFGVFVYPTIAVFDRDRKLQYEFGSNTINTKKRVEGGIRFLLGEIGADELEKIMHPVVEKIDPELAKIERQYNFAKISFSRNHFSTAKKIIESSLKNHPEHALSYSLYGYILIQEKNCKSGLKQFERALELDPDLEEAQKGKQVCVGMTVD